MPTSYCQFHPQRKSVKPLAIHEGPLTARRDSHFNFKAANACNLSHIKASLYPVTWPSLSALKDKGFSELQQKSKKTLLALTGKQGIMLTAHKGFF